MVVSSSNLPLLVRCSKPSFSCSMSHQAFGHRSSLIRAAVQRIIKETGISVLLVEQHLHFVRQSNFLRYAERWNCVQWPHVLPVRGRCSRVPHRLVPVPIKNPPNQLLWGFFMECIRQLSNCDSASKAGWCFPAVVDCWKVLSFFW